MHLNPNIVAVTLEYRVSQMGMKPGPEIGRLLKEMLELVIDGKLENNGGSLFDYAKERGAL